MIRIIRITIAATLLALTGSAIADSDGALAGAEQAFTAPDTGSHSTQSTDRGGKPADDGEFSVVALLEWLTGQRD